MNNSRVLLAHGAGGKLSHDLLRDLFLPAFDNEILRRLDDSGIIPTPDSRIAFTTDSYVVKPTTFPGGDIGRLAICGTVNDLAMVGARPLGLSASFILEEGLLLADLEGILHSMKETAQEAGVMVVTGDTKVVEHGAAERLYITTSGIGYIPEGISLGSSNAKEGDLIIINGPIGDHEIAVLIERGEFSLQGEVQSDCSPLNKIVELMLETCDSIHVLRDPTRGGLATTLWEIAHASNTTIVIEEERIPIRHAVRGVCDLLGLDPYYLANEGKLVAFVPEKDGEKLLAAMRTHPQGKEAVVIGRVDTAESTRVLLRTTIGGHRILEPLSGEQFPRIC